MPMKPTPRFALIAALTLFAFAAFPTPVHALGDYVRIEAAPWVQGFSGNARIDGSFFSGTSFDFEDDLDLGGDENVPVGRIQLRWLKKNRLVVDAIDMSRSGSGTISQNITFNDTVYTAGQDVDSTFDLRLLRANYRYSFVDFKLVEVGFDTALNLAQVFVAFDGSISGPSSIDEDVPFPTVGAYVIVKPVPGLGLRVEANGLSLDFGGNTIDLVDARAQIEYYFMHFFGAFAGYRVYRLDLEAEDFGHLESNFDGAYFGLGFKF
jgi:hypothetical protein